MNSSSRWIADHAIDFNPPLDISDGSTISTSGATFSGEKYAPIIRAVTGIGITPNHVPNEAVKKISEKLRKTGYCEAMQKCKSHKMPAINESEYRSLGRMFAAYSEAGGEIRQV